MTQPLAILVALVVSFAPAAESRQTAPSAPLKIVVIAGEGAVNIIQYKSAVAPVVEIRDGNDRPVAGATVTFAIGDRKSATFASGAPSFNLTTNAAGRAVAAPITPLRKGAVRIEVSASFQGQTAAATISQTNVMTAEQAKSSGSSGGGLSAGKIGAIAAAAGGAVFAIKSFTYKPADDPVSSAVMSWIVVTSANGASITPCTSPASTCELKLSDNEGVVQLRVDMNGIAAAENKLVFACGACQMISGTGSEETYSFAPPPAHQTYEPGIKFPGVGLFPVRATWTSGGATLASFTILFTVVP